MKGYIGHVSYKIPQQGHLCQLTHHVSTKSDLQLLTSDKGKQRGNFHQNLKYEGLIISATICHDSLWLLLGHIDNLYSKTFVCTLDPV